MDVLSIFMLIIICHDVIIIFCHDVCIVQQVIFKLYMSFQLQSFMFIYVACCSLILDEEKQVMGKYAKNFLPILANLIAPVTGDKSDASRLSALETLKCYLKVAERKVIVLLFAILTILIILIGFSYFKCSTIAHRESRLS
jgi:hypothetical protein